MNLVDGLRADARALGFDACRIVRAGDAPNLRETLDAWLAEGAAGDMDWMAETAERRSRPQALWPDVRSIVMLAMNYGPAEDPLANLTQPECANISVYARHRDYHDLVKGRLKLLASKLVSRAGGDVKVFVDTAPVMEKPLAALAGLGWQGKHTNLVSRDFGSWLFLGSIFSTLDLPPDALETDHCGQCRACMHACPTQAITAPYRLDARRCISYLTIEHKGPIPREHRAAIGNRIYGCDDCLAVCPWNKFASSAHESKLVARENLVAPRLADFARMEDAEFRAFFSGNPIKRIGVARFLRNVMIAIGNARDASLAPLAEGRLTHPSPLVRGAAVWAVARLCAADRLAQLAALYRARETDADVAAEWRHEIEAQKNEAPA
jgi:epoxyqueuosine reductase